VLLTFTFRYEGLAGIHDNFALEPKNLCSFPLTFENFINQEKKKNPKLWYFYQY